jgi:hypothetical protein
VTFGNAQLVARDIADLDHLLLRESAAAGAQAVRHRLLVLTKSLGRSAMVALVGALGAFRHGLILEPAMLADCAPMRGRSSRSAC